MDIFKHLVIVGLVDRLESSYLKANQCWRTESFNTDYLISGFHLEMNGGLIVFVGVMPKPWRVKGRNWYRFSFIFRWCLSTVDIYCESLEAITALNLGVWLHIVTGSDKPSSSRVSMGSRSSWQRRQWKRRRICSNRIVFRGNHGV